MLGSIVEERKDNQTLIFKKEIFIFLFQTNNYHPKGIKVHTLFPMFVIESSGLELWSFASAYGCES